jgi:RNA polymerase sigma-70 factor, ECF subfamily
MTPGDEGPDDERRFTALYRQHHALVHDFACRRVGNDLAQEVVSETFLVAWRRLDDIPETPVPWLYRVALFEIANLRRRTAKTSRLHHALVENRSGAGGTESDVDTFSALAHAVGIAFESLRPRDQEILRLAAWEQLSAAEGAAVLQCSISAYRMRLHRARIRLATTSGARDLLRTEPAALPGSSIPRPVLVIGRSSLNGTELAL